MKLIWTGPARRDILDIYRYIAVDNPQAADGVRLRIRNCIALLQNAPGIGRPGRNEGTRELIVTGTPYIVPYRIKGQSVQILRIYHAARLWPEEF